MKDNGSHFTWFSSQQQSILKTNNFENGIWNENPDTGLVVLGIMGITSILKIMLEETPDHALSKMLYTNHQSRYGMMTLNLAEQENSYITPWICLPSPKY